MQTKFQKILSVIQVIVTAIAAAFGANITNL